MDVIAFATGAGAALGLGGAVLTAVRWVGKKQIQDVAEPLIATAMTDHKAIHASEAKIITTKLDRIQISVDGLGETVKEILMDGFKRSQER